LGTTVRAAGGVLWRPAPEGREVCIVHRPRHDDWSLPKGKLKDGEHPLTAGVREVFEETGMSVVPECGLPGVAYDLPDGVPKTVDFWLMRAGDTTSAGPADPDEVDEVAWLPVPDASEKVSYREDARLLQHVARLPPVTAVVPLVRHGHAGRRDAFPGDDSARPLDERGRAEADAMATLLALFGPRRLYSATPLRCRQTLEPLATLLDLPVIADAAFNEPEPGQKVADRVAVAAARLTEVRDGEPAVVCSQGKLMPQLLAFLDGSGDGDGDRNGDGNGHAKAYKTPKGGGWVLSFTGDRLIGLTRL
jgi:8-oxo-dGTP diphosphatase